MKTAKSSNSKTFNNPLKRIMRILLLIDNLGSGGAQKQIATLAKLLKESGHKVEFLTYNEGDFFADSVKRENICINKIATTSYLIRMVQARNFIRKKNLDAVISFMDAPNFLNCFSAIGGKSWKVITSERSNNSSAFNSFRGKVFRWFQRFSDIIVCNSENSREMWEQKSPRYSHKLITIYNPVILPVITARYIPKLNGKLNIVIAASYSSVKNMDGLIMALRMLSPEEKMKINIEWYGRKEITQGNTSVYDNAVKQIRKYNLDGIIHLKGETKEIANIMFKADAVGLFSRLEGLPNAICEAMMMGKPILMTKVSDFNKLVDDSNGFLCDWDDTESIKNILISSSNLTIEKLISLGKNSKIKAQKLFSPSILVERWNIVLK